MPDLDLPILRQVRDRARKLRLSVVEDLIAFLHREDKHTFVRLPDSKHDPGDVGITVTASCLMGLALTGELNSLAKRPATPDWSAKQSFEDILVNGRWMSSGLVNMNAFTSTLVLRSFAFLVQKEVFQIADVETLKHFGIKETRDTSGKPIPAQDTNVWRLWDVFADLGRNADQLKVEKYPTSTALVYWFIDAIERSKLTEKFDEGFWLQAASWGAREFWKQESLTVADNDVLMDPIAMAMAACLCKKLKSIAENGKSVVHPNYLEVLPSETELQFSLKMLFNRQSDSGIWPKYFPLFHYPDAGANFCFTFEMLEAVLNEFGRDDDLRLLEIEGLFEGLSKALRWCEENRFEFRLNETTYKGWNSGGQISSLTSGKPESWATAVVHMFLWELDDVLSRRIEQQVLRAYRAQRENPAPPALDELADIEILIRGKPQSLKQLLLEHIIDPALKDARELRRNGLTSGKVSALLFGPPGTSKTETCAAIAKRLGWPLVKIDPSHFLHGGITAISVYADKIFTDLLDLNAAIVLFDEMDALVQTRDDEDSRLDVTSQLLTTSMLPKLSELHDRRRIIFFMATNFQNRFDQAIKRSGRFDLLLCMGPPRVQSKLKDLRLFLKKGTPTGEVEKCINLLQEYIKTEPALGEMLSLFTFGEFKALLNHLQKEAKDTLAVALDNLQSKGMLEAVEVANEFSHLRRKDAEELLTKLNRKDLKDIDGNSQITYDYLKKNKIKLLPIVRYLADKNQSKIQG